MRNILVFSLFLAVCGLGCGGLGGGSTGYNVGGKVTYEDGKPVPGGDVTFTSGRRTITGSIIGGGSYSMSERVPSGTYKVSVNIRNDSLNARSEGPLVDPKYTDPETSELVCEVKEATTFDIKVERPKE